MLTKKSLSALILIAGSVVARHSYADSGTGYKFTPGEKIYCTTEETHTFDLTYPDGRRQPNTQTQLLEMTWTVGQVEADGTAHILQRLTRVQGTRVLDPIVGLPFELQISRRGEPFGANLPQNTREALNTGSVSAQLRATFDEEGIKAMAIDRLMQFPMKQADATGPWTIVHQFGTNRVIRVYTPLGMESFEGKRSAKIALREEVKIDPKFRRPGIEYKDHPGTGFIYFDPVEGRLLQKTVETPSELIIHAQNGDILQKSTAKMVVKFKYSAVNVRKD